MDDVPAGGGGSGIEGSKDAEVTPGSNSESGEINLSGSVGTKKPDPPRELDYDWGRVLGEGTFGEVYIYFYFIYSVIYLLCVFLLLS